MTKKAEICWKFRLFSVKKFFSLFLTRADDLGRIVIPKEIRRTLRIREGDPLLTALTVWERYIDAISELARRLEAQR